MPRTRHNVGFRAVDRLAERLGTRLDRAKFRGLYGQALWQGQKLVLLKPQTFVNASGLSVMDAARFYKLPPERVLVLSDDISLEVGRLRVRASGSAGGHNGIKSIIGALNSEAFPRVKIGVGAKPCPEYELADWVLSNFTASEESGSSPPLTTPVLRRSRCCKTAFRRLRTDSTAGNRNKKYIKAKMTENGRKPAFRLRW